MPLSSAALIAAASYMTDVTPKKCRYHSWHVALVAERISQDIAPELCQDVFFAGLLHDLGAVGSINHITECSYVQEQQEDLQIQNHTVRGSALIECIPGLSDVSKLVKYHHEWWNGEGYPFKVSGNNIPLGSQILRIVDTADIAGCFSSRKNMLHNLKSIACLTGSAWSREIWALFVKTTADAGFYEKLMDHSQLPIMISEKIKKIGTPKQLDNEEGVERIFHIFAAMVDMKDASTSGHSLRVARYAYNLASCMELSDDACKKVYLAGLVHDCGRLGIPTMILNRSGRLNDKEMSVVREHAQMTIRCMSCLPDQPEMTEIGHIAGHDHERYDGTGYPDKLSGERIPKLSRIICAVDALDSMITSSSYRLLSPKCAILRLQQAAGKQFDPKVVRALVSAVENGKFQDINLAA